ncbi:MAG: aspartate carbamoyltransferase catalytic subunit [Erysipelotrichaceae bacterium]
MNNLFNLHSLSIQEIRDILISAESFHNNSFKGYHNKVIGNLFFEPSTRTSYSFQMAAHRLGCQVLNFSPESSSLLKGESFYDTVKTFESLGVSALIIRHPDKEYYKQLTNINVPIINGGDGTGNHPTQSLLDLLTIYQEFGYFAGLKVVIVGDIKHSRVAHTNIEIMQRLDMEVFISGPTEFKEEKYNYLNFDTAIKTCDVIMLLRVQHERHQLKTTISTQQYHQQYGLTLKRVKTMKKDAIILHPAPFNRNVEIADEVVECQQSRIFKQIENGVYIRMALIARALEGK